PAESALRDSWLAVELARLAGWSEPDLSDVFYRALLYHIGCTGAVAAQSRLGAGDDVNVRRWMSEADYANRPQLMRIAMTKLVPKWDPANWAPAMAALVSAGRDLPEALANTAEAAARLSQRLGASPRVTASLSHAYGRWDGQVFPSLRSGASVPYTWPTCAVPWRTSSTSRRPLRQGTRRGSPDWQRPQPSMWALIRTKWRRSGAPGRPMTSAWSASQTESGSRAGR